MGDTPAPTNRFLGAGLAVAFPDKCICRGGWSPHPPLQMVSLFFLKNYLIRKNSKPRLKNVKFSPLAYKNLYLLWKIPKVQFRFFIVWMCGKDKVALKLYERVVILRLKFEHIFLLHTVQCRFINFAVFYTSKYAYGKKFSIFYDVYYIFWFKRISRINVENYF